jgi:hypothetical protein
MTPEELAKFWHNGINATVLHAKMWDQLTEQEQSIRIHVAEMVLNKVESKHINHVLDQYALAQSVARMERQISRLNTEIFGTRITKHSDSGTVRRQTLLGRVDELSGMAALGPVDQSFFLE